MADPITWGLLNLIKKRVKGVQTTLDGVSDQVSGLPDSLDADFTEVENAISGVSNDVIDSKNEIITKINEVKERMDSFSDALSVIRETSLSTNGMVSDILNSTNISDWTKNLEEFGKSSETYSNSERMNVLIKEPSVTQNMKITSIMYDWAVSNNAVPAYFTSCVGKIDWSSFTSIESICSNATAFENACGSEAAFSSMLVNANDRHSIFNNYSITEKILASSSVALSVLRQKQKTETVYTYLQPPQYNYSGNIFVLSIQTSCYKVDLTFKDGTKETLYDGKPQGGLNLNAINKFGLSLSQQNSSGYSGGSTIVCVDFS